MNVVVAAETARHAQRIRCSLEELRQHQIIELEARTPRGLHAEIARLRINVIGATR